MSYFFRWMQKRTTVGGEHHPPGDSASRIPLHFIPPCIGVNCSYILPHLFARCKTGEVGQPQGHNTPGHGVRTTQDHPLVRREHLRPGWSTLLVGPRVVSDQTVHKQRAGERIKDRSRLVSAHMVWRPAPPPRGSTGARTVLPPPQGPTSLRTLDSCSQAPSLDDTQSGGGVGENGRRRRTHTGLPDATLWASHPGDRSAQGQ